MAQHKPTWRRKRDEQLTESMTPYLEPGEDVREIFQGQSLLSPWLYLLLIPLLAAPVKRRRTMVLTSRYVYQFSMRAWSGRQVKAVLQKTPCANAVVHAGLTSLRVDGGPRLYATPDSGRGVRRKMKALIEEARATASVTGPDSQGSQGPSPERDTVDVLAERFARGEIAEDEYRSSTRRLGQQLNTLLVSRDPRRTTHAAVRPARHLEAHAQA